MRALKVYLAAPYSQKEQIKTYAEELRSVGIEVTSSWLDEPHKPTTGPDDLTYEDNQRYAVRDVQDVVAAEVLVFFTDPTKTIVRGGRHVEFGIAIGVGLYRALPIFVVGGRENIFHYLPQVHHFDTWSDMKFQLMTLAKCAAIA